MPRVVIDSIIDQMWKKWWKKDLQGILDRLDCLETAPASLGELVTIEGTLESIRQENVALRESSSSQEQLAALESRVNRQLQQITAAVAEGIDRVDRSERRVVATVKRARKELKERGFTDEGVEAEHHQLHVLDEAGGNESPVPAVREEVGGAGEQASSVRGVSLVTLQKVRGRL